MFSLQSPVMIVFETAGSQHSIQRDHERMPERTFPRTSKRKFDGKDGGASIEFHIANGNSVASSRRRKTSRTLPPLQKQLQLHRVGGEYELAHVPLPQLHHQGEVLIRVRSIGLNPIDWKAAYDSHQLVLAEC